MSLTNVIAFLLTIKFIKIMYFSISLQIEDFKVTETWDYISRELFTNN